MNNHVMIIAEAGVNHNGNYDLAVKMIHEAKRAGADIASMIIEEAQDINAMPRHDWRDKTLMTRYFKEVIFFNDSTNNEQQ